MPDTVKVVTTIALQGVLEKLEPEFKRNTGYGIAMAFGPPARATQMVKDGEACDIVMTTPEDTAELAKLGKVAPGPARVVLSMIMGIAVRTGATKPDIGTTEKFKHAILAAKSVTYADPERGSPSARHFLKVADNLGIGDAVRAKALVSSGLIARHVAAGEAEVAVQQLSELLMVEGVDIVGKFPPELQNVVPLAAAIHAQSATPKEAAALIDLLATPQAKAIIEQAGLVPA